MAKRINTLSAVSAFLYEEDWEYQEYQGYSGRGMYGKEASAAFTTDAGPTTAVGQQLTQNGWSYDNMGRDWIYYLQ